MCYFDPEGPGWNQVDLYPFNVPKEDSSMRRGRCYGFREGWICPKCGAVLAPWMSFCLFCAPKGSKTEKPDTKDLIKINEEVQDEQEEG